MAVLTHCPGCHKQHSFPDLVFGRTVRCTNCGRYFRAGMPQVGLVEPPPPEPEEQEPDVLPPPRRVTIDEDRPARPRRRKQSRSPFVLVAILGSLAILLTLLFALCMGAGLLYTAWG